MYSQDNDVELKKYSRDTGRRKNSQAELLERITIILASVAFDPEDRSSLIEALQTLHTAVLDLP